MRWEHPERGLVYPEEFIPLAEETGLIVQIGQRVLEEACIHAVRWPESSDGVRLPVAVNVSAKQFQQPDFPEKVELALRNSGLEPGRLALEITESLLLDDNPLVLDHFQRIKRSGVMFVIDDFGTGYSSLSYLRHFPVDCLKVDRSFVSRLGQSPEETGIISAIVGIAHSLGINVTAEGVETAEQLQALKEIGCDLCQGYYWERAVGEDLVAERIRCGRTAGY